MVGIPKAEARRRFILNKIYVVQEGTTADDLFIIDEKVNKWAVEDVSDATAGALLLTALPRQCRVTGESGRRSRSSKLEKNAAFKGGVLIT